MSDLPIRRQFDGVLGTSRRRRWLFYGLRIVILASLLGVAAWAIDSGFRLRVWTWNYTHAVHYYPDINNGYRWGIEGNQPSGHSRGFLNVYDLAASQADRNNNEPPEYGLDYAPLRLLLVTRWVGWTIEKQPELAARAFNVAQSESGEQSWEAPYAFFAPMLRFNSAMELLAAVGIFLLARHWAIRGDRRGTNALKDETAPLLKDVVRPFRGCFAGLIGALLLWFSPAVIISTHGWPTWDEWVIPCFVWAVYLACIDWWFVAGLVIATGAMLKGQQLFVAGMFVLWPIFLRQWRQALRWTAGLVFGVGAIASPWMLSYVPGGVNANSTSAHRVCDPEAIAWIICVALASGVLPLLQALSPLPTKEQPVQKQHRRRLRFLVVRRPLFLVLAFGLIFWPFLLKSNRDDLIAGVLLAILPISQLIYRVKTTEPERKRGLPFTILTRTLVYSALTLGISILLCGSLFHGSLNWLYIGWGYGTRHYPHMTMGVSDNLASLLDRRFGWHELTELVGTFDPHPLRLWPTHTILFSTPTAISIRILLCSLYVVTFLTSVMGVAIQYRRNDPRFLVAVTATWLMFFAFLPQIHERYLLYAAGFGCCLTAVDLGATLLNFFFTVLTSIMMLHVMLGHAADEHRLHLFAQSISPTFSRSLYSFIDATYPDAGWAVLLCAGIFLYLSLAPSRRETKWNPFEDHMRRKRSKCAMKSM